MENKLEQLLNSLIEKGWEPFGYNDLKQISYKGNGEVVFLHHGIEIPTKLRFLTVKESGLWQFVCENGMIKEEHKHERILDPIFGEGWADCKRQEHDGNYGYRLIESALCDEDKLEKFLLSNIKVDVGNRG